MYFPSNRATEARGFKALRSLDSEKRKLITFS